jgi:predicted HTH domain antitoxin
MVSRESLLEIASNVQIFPDVEQKERFLFVVGALVSRVISLKKAAEIMELEVEVLLQLLEITGIEFSYLSNEDIALEKSW